MQAGLWIGCGLAVVMAVMCGWGDAARLRRKNLDRISVVDWRTAQLVAIVSALVLASLALST